MCLCHEMWRYLKRRGDNTSALHIIAPKTVCEEGVPHVWDHPTRQRRPSMQMLSHWNALMNSSWTPRNLGQRPPCVQCPFGLCSQTFQSSCCVMWLISSQRVTLCMVGGVKAASVVVIDEAATLALEPVAHAADDIHRELATSRAAQRMQEVAAPRVGFFKPLWLVWCPPHGSFWRRVLNVDYSMPTPFFDSVVTDLAVDMLFSHGGSPMRNACQVGQHAQVRPHTM
jgi:hypothetical protein